MRAVAVLNLKGGVGKTTLCMNLARGLDLAGHRVVVLDADPQASAIDWCYAREDRALVVTAVNSASGLAHQLAELKREKQYDIAIIDGSPHQAAIAVGALKVADLVLIPVQPSPVDIWATNDVVELVREARRHRRGKPKAAFVVWRMIPRTTLAGDVVAALDDFKLPVLPVHIHQRVAYANTAIDGGTVLDLQPSSPAAKEMFALTETVGGLL